MSSDELCARVFATERPGIELRQEIVQRIRDLEGQVDALEAEARERESELQTWNDRAVAGRKLFERTTRRAT